MTKKGFIFTLDVAVALIVISFFLAVATSFGTQSNQDPFPSLQIVKYGADTMRVLQMQGFLDSPDQNAIAQEVSRLMPDAYSYELQSTGTGSCEFTIGNVTPDDQRVVSGKYYYTAESEFCTMRYSLWLS